MGRKLALIIGNCRYDDTGLARLPTADVDVRELAEVLRAPDIGHFDEIVELPDMGLAVVRRSIAQFFSQARKDDLLVFYFSGHGVKDENGHLYLAVRDTELKLLSGTSIEAAYITAQMDRSVSRRQVLILDCCHSGAFAHGAKASAAQVVGTGPVFEGTGYGHVVLTATDSTQYAWEGDRIIGESDKSVFTHYMLQGLRTGEADLDGDGRITVDELYDYVYEQVVRETPKQTPGKWSYKQQGEIVVARNPKPHGRSAALPLELQAMLESPIPRIRSEAIAELKALLHSKHSGLEAAARKGLEQLRTDDSRKVSSEAEEVLAEISRAERDAEERLRAEKERQARERRELEREASERAARDALSVARRRIEDLLRREDLDQAAVTLAQVEHDSGDVSALDDLRRQYQRLRERRDTVERLRAEDARRQKEEAARRAPEKRSGPVPDTLLMVPDQQRPEETQRPRAILAVVRESRWLQSALVLVLIAIGVVGWQLVRPPAPKPPAPGPAAPIETTVSTPVEIPPVVNQPSGGSTPAPSTGPVAATGTTKTPPPKPTPGPSRTSGPAGPTGSPAPSGPVATPPVTADEGIPRLLKQGDDLLKSAKYEEAIASYEEAARLGSAEAVSRANRARQDQTTQVRQRLNQVGPLLDAGSYGDALRLVDEALAIHSKSAEAAGLRQKTLDGQNFERSSKLSAENPFTQRQVEAALKALNPGRLLALIKDFGTTFILDSNEERQFRTTASNLKIDPPQVEAIVRLVAPPRDRSAGAEWTAPTDHRQMVWVPAGTFQMGSPANEPAREPDETSHVATVTGGFWMESTEVTYRAFQKFLQANPEWQKARIDRRLHDGNYLSDWKGNAFPPGKADAPVVHVSWYAAQAYAKWAGKRLPTEAEWEYACRVGRRTTYWWGDSFDAAPSGGASTRNPWGLSSMLGGVWEWTSSLYRNYPYADDGRNDPAAQGPRVIRGGAGTSGPGILRSANRNRDEPERCSDLLGFRCVF